MKPDPPGVLDFFTLNPQDSLLIQSQKGKEKEMSMAELPVYNRGAKGTVIRGGINRVQLKPRDEKLLEHDAESADSVK